MENTSDIYYEKLRNAEEPGRILAAYYCSIYNKDVTRSEIIMCNKLVKIFGRFLVFFSIQDMSGSVKEPEEVYPYLHAICQRRFEASHNDSVIVARNSLSPYMNMMQREKEKVLLENIKIQKLKGRKTDG